MQITKRRFPGVYTRKNAEYPLSKQNLIWLLTRTALIAASIVTVTLISVLSPFSHRSLKEVEGKDVASPSARRARHTGRKKGHSRRLGKKSALPWFLQFLFSSFILGLRFIFGFCLTRHSRHVS